jgi:hypothetical protein
MIQSLLVPMLLCASAVQAQTAAVLPEGLTAHLREITLLHVDFTQTRSLAALSRPLKATGSMVLSRERGVIWAIRKPVVLSYVITPAGLREIGPDGKSRKKAGQDAPMVAQMGRIFQSLLQGKWDGLQDFFQVRGEGRAEQWKVLLVPKPQTASFIKGVQIYGGRFIDRVHLEEPGGDAMDLVFEHPRTQDPLTEAEIRLFSQD